MSVRAEVVKLLDQALTPVPLGSVVRFRLIETAPRVQRRVQGAGRSQFLIEEAREQRLKEGTPFWHALFLAGEGREEGVPLEILQSALFHRQSEATTEYVLDGNTASEVAEASLKLGVEEFFGLESTVVLPNGMVRYIPMLDFSVKSKSPGGERTAIASIEALNFPGFLAASGRSYHFYGSRLLDAAEQSAFWARALLLTPIVDERWIAHQLLAGRASLRVSPNNKGQVPKLLALPALR